MLFSISTSLNDLHNYDSKSELGEFGSSNIIGFDVEGMPEDKAFTINRFRLLFLKDWLRQQFRLA